MSEEKPFEIVILDKEGKPLVAEGKLRQAGEQLANATRHAAQNAWQSDARKKVTGKIQEGAGVVLQKGAEVVHERVVKQAEVKAREQVTAVHEQIRTMNWKEAFAKGLRWTSQQLRQLSQKLTPKDEPPT